MKTKVGRAKQILFLDTPLEGGKVGKSSHFSTLFTPALSPIQGGLTSVYKTEIVQNLVHHEPQCLYTYVSAGVLCR